MQWDSSKNLGFSQADPEMLYLPVDPKEDAPTVEAQEADPDSMLHHMRSLIAMRHVYEDLQCYSPFEVYSAEKGSRLFAYKRGDLLLAVNPGLENITLSLDGDYFPIFTVGDSVLVNDSIVMGAQSFVILEPCE